ncbi:hypothetical protein QYF36_023463 [Acer negundo]|nr:hypothetical protein QYF36_022172 [Acer negundo]KAK4856996.1 hypothetical protein QYF36_023463 [Acer negundo]
MKNSLQKNELILASQQKSQAYMLEQEQMERQQEHDRKATMSRIEAHSIVANEEMEKEEMNIEVKKAEDVLVEESLLFKESEPFTPSILSLGRLHKGPMISLFLVSSYHFINCALTYPCSI